MLINKRLIGIALLVFLGYFLLTRKRTTASADEPQTTSTSPTNGNKNTSGNSGGTANNTTTSVSRLSYSDAQYETWATKLFNLCEGYTNASEEQQIMDILKKMKTTEDLLRLREVFGIRKKMTFDEWIYNEFDNNQLAEINNYYHKAGINYTF